MEVREGCNVGVESSIGRGRGGEHTSGSHCQGLPSDGDLLTAVEKDRSDLSLIDAAFRLER